MMLQPTGDKVIVKRKEEEEKTKSGIVLPDSAKEKPLEGEVISVGPGRVLDNGQRSPMDVNKGDLILFSKYGGTEVKYKEEAFLILDERDILAVVK
ncbi:co-chaperone GroES [Candidatus Margulisiibacteriota bacterium]